LDTDFNTDKQKLLIEYMLTEATIFQRCYNILKPSYFEKEFREPIKYILDHAEKFSATPSPKQIRAETGIKFSLVENMKDQDIDYALVNLEELCQRASVVEAVTDSIEYIESGNRGKVLEMVKAAMEVGLQKDLGTVYFEDPRSRLERMKLKSLIPTGWYDIDRKLYGGLNKGEVTVFAAGCVTAGTKIKVVRKMKINT